MLNSNKTRVFDETGRQIGYIREMDLKFSLNSTLVEAIIEKREPPTSWEGSSEEYPFSVEKWWVNTIEMNEDGILEIRLLSKK